MLLLSSHQTVGPLRLQPTNADTLLDTHYDISLYAIERGIHVLVTKPAVQKLEHHNLLIEAAKKHNVVVFVEHHKR